MHSISHLQNRNSIYEWEAQRDEASSRIIIRLCNFINSISEPIIFYYERHHQFLHIFSFSIIFPLLKLNFHLLTCIFTIFCSNLSIIFYLHYNFWIKTQIDASRQFIEKRNKKMYNQFK